jgi:hypothetical protein
MALSFISKVQTGKDMLRIKKYIMGAFIGLLVGLWMGVNIGAERPLWSNPFAKKDLSQKAKEVASEAWKDAKKAARDTLTLQHLF